MALDDDPVVTSALIEVLVVVPSVLVALAVEVVVGLEFTVVPVKATPLLEVLARAGGTKTNSIK